MPQPHIFESGVYTDAQGQEQYGVNPADVEAYYASQQAGSAGDGGAGEGGDTGGATIDDPVIPVEPGQTPEERAEEALEGYETPMGEDDIIKRRQEQQRALREQAENIFGPQVAKAERLGEQRKGSLQGQFGVTRGLGMSTAELGFMNNVQREIDDQIAEINQAKAAYIANGDAAAMQRADEALEQLRTSKNNLILKKAELVFQFAAEDRTQQAFDLEMISALQDIPAGQKVTIGGKTYEGTGTDTVDPFFTGSNIVDMMKNMPVGATKTVIDPNTGAEWNIEGIASEDPSLLITKNTDNAGNQTIIARDKNTGEIMWSAKDTSVGKASVGDGTDIDDDLSKMVADAKADIKVGGEGSPYYNTDDYMKWMNKFINSDPTSDRGLDQFLLNFPILKLNLSGDDAGAEALVNMLEGLNKFDTEGSDSDYEDQAALYGMTVDEYKKWKGIE